MTYVKRLLLEAQPLQIPELHGWSGSIPPGPVQGGRVCKCRIVKDAPVFFTRVISKRSAWRRIFSRPRPRGRL